MTEDSARNAESTTADALAAAGDEDAARDIGALDNAAAAVDRKLAARKRGLVERLIYGPTPPVDELGAGGRLAATLGAESHPVVEAALGCLAAGRAFTADGKLSAELRAAVTRDKAYGFTIPASLGGASGSYVELAQIEESLAANGLGPLAVEISGELTIGAGSLLGYGSDEQRKTFLPMIAEGRLMGFALTEVAVGVNAKKIEAYVETDEHGDHRLFAEGAQNKLWITNACHGALLGIVARLGRGGDRIGLFVVELPERDVEPGTADHEFRLEPSGVAAFTANYNSRLHFRNFPIPAANKIPADGVEVLFYCLRMGRCMLAAMSAGYQRMLARDAAYYALERTGVGGPVIKHELPRLALGRMLGGSLQARALAYLSLSQDADRVDLAGLRDLTKSAAASAGLESMIACEHVLGGRAFDAASRVNAARVDLHLFGVVEGEDDMIRMGMVRDVTQRFVRDHLAVLLDVLRGANVGRAGEPLPGKRLLRIGPTSFARAPLRSTAAFVALLRQRGFWRLTGWIAKQAGLGLAHLPLRLVPASLLPRYAGLPYRLRGYARFAERKLRGLRWTYLGLSLTYQLELTRAQIPLQRLGLRIEHLVSMLAICHHAPAQSDESQRDIAVLQAQLLKGKYDAIKLLGSPRELARLRRATARIGRRIEDDTLDFFAGLEAEPFAHPWTDDPADRPGQAAERND